MKARGAIVTDLLSAEWFEMVTDRERGVAWGDRGISTQNRLEES